MKNNIDDDNRVIADMSEVGGRFRKKFLNTNVPEESKQEGEKLRGKNLFVAILGSLSASLLIGLVYIVIFGLVIFIMYTLFKSKLGG